MSFRSLAVCLCLAFLLPFGVYGQAPQTAQAARTTLTISCDADCSWSVDDEQQGALKKGEEAHVEVLFGAHSIEATSSDGRHWEQPVEIRQPNEEHIRISFAPGSNSTENGARAAFPAENVVQSDESTGRIPTFYAQGRQVIVEAEVWNQKDKNTTADTSWIPKELLEQFPKKSQESVIHSLSVFPTPSRGLLAKDFQVFDNDVPAKINYFKEDDFRGADTTGHGRTIRMAKSTSADQSGTEE
jgi:hypothetical protein